MMLVQTARGGWRLTPPAHKLLLTAHIVASVGWLGIAVAKIVLGVVAARAADAAQAQALLLATGVIDRAFPPAAILTLLTGVTLGLVTKWGIVQYSWVLAKLGLTVAVPVTAVRLADRLLVGAQTQVGGASVDLQAVGGWLSAPSLLVWLVGAHVVMLTAATVLSIYKPWGLSPIGRRRQREGQRPDVAVRAA
ncbi:MAG: hypothetical protein IT306_26840 [Chloroflexi bacterium]|nr:hypothetical protein [Chloroflexota bacterium]